jgi:hypothetical protein
LKATLGASAFAAWIEPAYLGACGQGLYLVASNGVAADRLRGDMRRHVREAWTAVDPLKRDLTVISRAEFERLRPIARQSRVGG